MLSLEQVLAHSSNIGIVKIANMLGKERTYSLLESLDWAVKLE